MSSGKCVLINDEKPIVIALNEHNSLEMKSNEIEVHIVSIASDDTQQLPVTSEQNTTGNVDYVTIILHNSKILTLFFSKSMVCSEVNGSFSCEICNKYFKSESELQTHHQQQHQNKKYQCSDCTKEFHTEKGLLTHIVTHNIQSNKRK